MPHRARMKELTALLNHHCELYHTLGTPEISDEEYDALYRELCQLERQHPGCIQPDSPTFRVGGKVMDGLPKYTHKERMYSLDNVFSVQEFADFARRLGVECEWYVDPKLDGLALELVYESGVLARAATRGNGIVGEDVTAQARNIPSIPRLLSTAKPPRLLEVRGEVLITKPDFARLNALRIEEGKRPYANARNAASGCLRRIEPSACASFLTFFAYGLGRHEGFLENFHEYFHERNMEIVPERHDHQRLALQNLGFRSMLGRAVETREDVESTLDFMENNRDSLPVDIDGAVLRVNHTSLWQGFGHTAHAPRYAVAYKFTSRKAVTRLTGITVQVGRSGVLTPVAELEPVALGGVMVSRATLHNAQLIAEKDIRIGDFVTLQRAADVIPDILGPVLEMRPENTAPYQFPTVCPICGAETVQVEGQSAIRCSNASCPAVLVQFIAHFVSRDALDIRSVGPSLIESMVQKGLVRTPADLFFVTADQLAALPRMARRSAQKAVESIASAAENVTLSRLIYALGIPDVGMQTAKTLASAFGSLQDLAEAPKNALLCLPDIGPEVSSSIVGWFSSVTNLQLVAKLEELGITPTHQVTSGALSGKSVLFTGTFSQSRHELSSLAEQAGAKLASSVSKKLSFLVVGENAGSKLEKAKKLGIETLSETEFLFLIGAVGPAKNSQ